MTISTFPSTFKSTNPSVPNLIIPPLVDVVENTRASLEVRYDDMLMIAGHVDLP